MALSVNASSIPLVVDIIPSTRNIFSEELSVFFISQFTTILLYLTRAYSYIWSSDQGSRWPNGQGVGAELRTNL